MRDGFVISDIPQCVYAVALDDMGFERPPDGDCKSHYEILVAVQCGDDSGSLARAVSCAVLRRGPFGIDGEFRDLPVLISGGLIHMGSSQKGNDMPVKEFRKRPVVVRAVQWTGDNLRECLEFIGKHPQWVDWFGGYDAYENRVRSDGNVIKIWTLEGVHDASVGDWIIRGVKGEHYPCKPDIFEQTYERVYDED